MGVIRLSRDDILTRRYTVPAIQIEGPSTGAAPPDFQVQQFKSSGTFTVPQGVRSVEYLIVGGGGGGGGRNVGGGGGAGGFRSGIVTLEEGLSYTVTVGGGGSGGGAPFPSPGANGSNSGIHAAHPFGYWASGGGGGGHGVPNQEDGKSGGSGGGGGGSDGAPATNGGV